MQSSAQTVDAYLAEQASEPRADLTALRALIFRAVPAAKEQMRYGMPSYFHSERLLFAMAAQKQHLALYICSSDGLSRYAARLKASSVGKGCVRFKRLEQLDLEALEALLGAVACSD